MSPEHDGQRATPSIRGRRYADDEIQAAGTNENGHSGVGMRTSKRVGVAGFVTTAVSFGPARSAYGLFLPEIRAGFDLSTSTLSMIAAVGYAGFLIGLIAAYFAEGANGPLAPILVGGTAATAGLAVVAVTTNTAVLAIAVATAASSAGFTWTPYNRLTQHRVASDRQDGTLAAVSTGTTIGLFATGGLALIVAAGGVDWRIAWAVFAVIAALSAAVNVKLIPRDEPGRHVQPIPDLRAALTATGSRRLLVIAVITGVVNSVWFSFGVDVVVSADGIDWFDNRAIGPVMFMALGVAGLTGLATGHLIDRRGLAFALLTALLAMNISLVVIGMIPTHIAAALGSAALQGIGIMTVSAAMAAYSLRIHVQNPVAGFTLVLIALAAGNISGPAITGLVGERFGLETTFIIVGITLAVASWGATRGDMDPIPSATTPDSPTE